MAKRSFLITAVMQLKGPKNIKQIVDDINRQLAGVKVNIAVNMPQNTVTKIQRVSTSLKQVAIAAKKAETDVERFGAQIARSVERYGAFTVATTGFIALIAKISGGISETIKFQRELVRIAQVSGQTLNNLKGLSNEVTRLAKQYGVASNTILESAVTLSQAGLSAKNVKIALESLAQTGVASTFGNIKDTTEASIAVMQQFGFETKDLGRILSSINKVSAQFAIESDDITKAIRKAGSSFQAAGGDMNEFLGVITAVRQTTRESADTIATGLRTIFARLQRPKTQNFLQSLGIDVLNDKNQFVGGFEAIKRISQALKDIPSTDTRYARIAEEVAGIRQINKFVPLIEKFDVAEKALNVSIRAGTSLVDDATKAQEAWAVQIERVNQAFLELLRTFADNSEVKFIASVVFNMAEGFLKLATSLETVLPYLVAFSGIKITQGLSGISRGFSKEIFKGKGFASGGVVGGAGNRDSEPAFLTPGEFVLRKAVVRKLGTKALNALNNGEIAQFATGGGYDIDNDGITGRKKTKQEISDAYRTILLGEPLTEEEKRRDRATLERIKQKSIQKKISKQNIDTGLDFEEDLYDYIPPKKRIPNYHRVRRQFSDYTQYQDSGGNTSYLYPPNSGGNGKNGGGSGGGFGFPSFGGFGNFKPNFSGLKSVGGKVASASNFLGENGLSNFFVLSSLNALSDATLGAENGFTQLTKVLTVTVGQFSVLTQLFKGLSSSAQFIGESSVFGNTFSKAGSVGNAEKGRVFREESRKLSTIALGERFGLSGGDFEKATVGDLVQTTRLSKSQQNTAYRNYAIDNYLSSIGQSRNGLSYDDIQAIINNDPKSIRAFNKTKRTLTSAEKTQALQNAQLESFEGTFGANPTKESVTSQGLKDLKSDPNYRARRRAEREEAKNFSLQKAEVARQRQRELEGRGARNVAIANLAAAGLTTLSTYAGGTLTASANKRIANGEDARSQSAFGTALSSGGTAAGVGLSAGFAIGGPVGAAIGAAALGIPVAMYTFTTALKEASDTLENVKFEESFEKLNKKIQQVLVGKLDAGNTIASNNKFFRDTASSYASGSVDVRTNIRSNIQNNSASFEALFEKIADSTKTFSDFEKITGNSLVTFARISDIPYTELKKKIEDQIKANEKLLKFNNNLTDAYQEQTIRLNNINDLIGAISFASIKQADSGQNLDRISGFAGGGSSSQSIGTRLSLFDAAKEGRGDLASFRAIVGNVSSSIGGPSASVGQEAVFASQIAKQLPNILLGLQKGNPLDVNGGIIDQLADQLNKVARDVGYSGTELQRAIISSASEILGAGDDEGKLIEAINGDLNGVINKLSSGLGNSSDVFKELVSVISDNVEQLKKGFSQYYDILDKSSDLELRRQDVLFSAFQTRNQFFDRETPLSDKLGFNQRRLGIISGQADNSVGGLRGSILRSQGNISRIDQLINSNFGNKNQVGLEASRAKEVDLLNRANKALEELATNSDNLGSIQEQIAKEQEKGRLKKEGLDTLVYGNKDQKKDLAKQILLTAFAAKNPSGLNAIPENLRGNVKDFIDKAGKSNIFGERADLLDKRLSKQAGVAAGVKGSIAEQITSGITPVIADLIKKFDEQVKVQTEAINAQIGLNNNVAENLKSALVDANKSFLDNLQKIFIENQKERKATQDAETKNNISVIKGQIGIRDNLARGNVNGISIGTKNLANLAGAIPELQRYGNLRESRNKILSDSTLAKNILSITPSRRYNELGSREITPENIDKLLEKIETQTGIKVSDNVRGKLQGENIFGVRGALDKNYVDKVLGEFIDSEKENQLKTVNKDLKETTATLTDLGVNAQALQLPFEKLNIIIQKLQVGLSQLNQINNPGGLENQLKLEKGKLGLASGGMVPGSGNYDSVPAMLTPGEFVLKKSAVRAIGLANLHEMNDIQNFASGGSVKDRIAARIAKRQNYLSNLRQRFADRKAGKYRRFQYDFGTKNPAASDYNLSRNYGNRNGLGFAQGNRSISQEQYQRETAYSSNRGPSRPKFRSGAGFNYRGYASGGLVGGSGGFDTSFLGQFDNALKMFSGSVDKLVNSLQSVNGLNITMSVRHDINVVFNGAETLGRLIPELRDMAVSTAKQEINKMIDSKFPDVGRV